VHVVSKACTRALEQADTIIDANTELTRALNKVSPLVADAYADGLAGDGPDATVDRVADLNVRIADAFSAAKRVPSQFDRYADTCRQEPTPNE
jgi:hypothetical protein